MKFSYSTFVQIAIAATFSVIFLDLSITAARAEAPALNITEYELDSNNVEECVNAAESVMKEAGFQDLEISQRDVFVTTEDSSVEMYCVRDGKTLILVLSGSNPNELQEIQTTLDERLSEE